MATFNGTQLNDTISGTNVDDIITGIGGDDVINGADGNDTITGGVGDDNVLGGSGDDVITIANGDQGTGTQIIDGGDDDDTLVTELAVANTDILVNGTSTILGNANTVSNIEYFQISNASDHILTAGEDDVFAFDVEIQSNQATGTPSLAIDVDAATYTGATGAVDNDGVLFDVNEGISINGTTYDNGDTYTTASGGSVVIGFASNVWTFTYTAAPQSNIELDVAVEDEVLAIQATQATTGTVLDIAVTLEMTSTGASIDLSGVGLDVDSATRVVAEATGSTITDGAGNDTIVGGAGGDNITLQSDADNTVWAGATDAAVDTILISGNGNNTVAGGANNDLITVSGNGDNTLYGGAGGEIFTFTGAEGNNAAWGGSASDVDAFTTDAVTTGDNVFGGGAGADTFNIDGTGDYTLFLGADDDNDVVNIADTADGDFTIFGGAGTAGTGANVITVLGDGTNTIYNGNGNDAVDVSNAEGDNTVYGGAGNDTLTADTNSDVTFVFVSGNGVDTIVGFEEDNADHLVDLSGLGFTDADDVLNNMTNNGANVELFVTAGQVIIFDTHTVNDFQTADPADWLIL